MTEVNIPGGAREWWQLLPSPYCHNPDVVVYLAPNTAVWKVMESLDGQVHLSAMELPTTREVLGLQVVRPELSDWNDHVSMFSRCGIKMATPAYIGPVSDLPTQITLHSGLCPLMYARDGAHRPMINLKRVFDSDTEEAQWN